jgi:hypothetical protein
VNEMTASVAVFGVREIRNKPTLPTFPPHCSCAGGSCAETVQKSPKKQQSTMYFMLNLHKFARGDCEHEKCNSTDFRARP